MTDAEPHIPPVSRRAARLRERDVEGAVASDASTAAPAVEGLSASAVDEQPTPRSRRAARTAEARQATPVRLARARRIASIGAFVAVAAALVLGAAAAVTAAVTAPPLSATADARTNAAFPVGDPTLPLPAPAESIPVPTTVSVPAVVDICAIPAFADALAAGDDVAAIAAAGGATVFRTSVALGAAPCVSLSDPARLWIVVNKMRPYDPIDYAPSSTTNPDGVRVTEGGGLRPDAAAALSAMISASTEAGVGEIALASGYRSYANQVSTYNYHLQRDGVEAADATSAHPGFSEHQSGLAGDVAPCNGGCGRLDELAGTAQGDFVAAHAWEYGFIIRYEEGYTAITGYEPEPWHLRYVGVDLAREYHAGGWHTFEEFFGLPAAPGYAG